MPAAKRKVVDGETATEEVEVTERVTRPRIVLVDGLIHGAPDEDHRMYGIGDTVHMTDGEFDAYQAAGVAVRNKAENE